MLLGTMKKYIVLGVNENPKYLYYLPLVLWGWEQLGWWPVIFYSGPDTQISKFVFNEREGFQYFIPSFNGYYKTETLAQVSRLYAAAEIDEGYLMTSDADMLPLSDYWFPNISTIDCYGRDLTDYHFPICYIGMEAYLWKKVMNIPNPNQYSKASVYDLMNRDMRKQKNMWGLDQDIITEKLVKYQINREDRGTDKRTGYPIGRVDRSNWRLDHPQFIDAHLPHDILTNDESYKKVCALLSHVWPTQDFSWYYNYHREFKKLL